MSNTTKAYSQDETFDNLSTWVAPWVALDPEPQPLPLIKPGLFARGSIQSNGVEAISALPVNISSAAFYIAADAHIVFARTCDMLEEMDSKAFLQEVPGNVRWHIQAYGLKKAQDDARMTYSANLRTFFIPIRDGSAPPEVYEYQNKDESIDIFSLLSVKVEYVSEKRCFIEINGFSQGGILLVQWLTNGLAFLYPDEASKVLLEAANIKQGTKTNNSDHYHHSPEKRKEAAEKYRAARARGEVVNKDAWAQSNYSISGRTLSNYVREFPPET